MNSLLSEHPIVHFLNDVEHLARQLLRHRLGLNNSRGGRSLCALEKRRNMNTMLLQDDDLDSRFLLYMISNFMQPVDQVKTRNNRYYTYMK